MRKLVVLFLVMGLVFGATAAEAGKKKKKKNKKPQKIERQVTGTYQSTVVVAVGTCAQTDAVNCVRIPNTLEETYVSAEVKDSTGQAVPVAVKADLDGNNSTETLYGVFCGKTDEPIKIDPGIQVTFWVGKTADTATLPCVAATNGSIDVTFSNMP